MANPNSITGKYLSGAREIADAARGRARSRPKKMLGSSARPATT
jgi:excinuclease UvrABC ATPase subunit